MSASDTIIARWVSILVSMNTAWCPEAMARSVSAPGPDISVNQNSSESEFQETEKSLGFLGRVFRLRQELSEF